MVVKRGNVLVDVFCNYEMVFLAAFPSFFGLLGGKGGNYESMEIKQNDFWILMMIAEEWRGMNKDSALGFEILPC